MSITEPNLTTAVQDEPVIAVHVSNNKTTPVHRVQRQANMCWNQLYQNAYTNMTVIHT